MNAEKIWHKSTFSGSGNCVEVSIEPDSISVRHTQDRDGTQLTFSTSEWTAFVQGVCAGQFDTLESRSLRRRRFWLRKQ
jgi:hypothetical protein